jgi:hypothetical protein
MEGTLEEEGRGGEPNLLPLNDVELFRRLNIMIAEARC